MRKLFAIALIAATASANEISYRTLQSGSPQGGTPLYDAGLRGEGQIVAILDTGVEYTSCYFAEPDGSHPPINTGSPQTGLDWTNVDPSRRKVIAYDFLFSCDQYPGAPGCEMPGTTGSLDNTGHGTKMAAAIAGDSGAYGSHDWADAIAPAAKLVVQDGGYVGGDACSHRPGFGCPVKLTPILEQAYRQGARIHANSWGDRQGFPLPLPAPTANYPASAQEIDAFVWSHPDLLVVFNTGNFSGTGRPPASSLSAPGSAKNTLQVGATRALSPQRHDDVIAEFSLFGPTRDGRIKPDIVGPGFVFSGDVDRDGNGQTCDTSYNGGTSYASPTIAGAAALVRQYYADGFYPSGSPRASDSFAPSAALMKATIISAARALAWRRNQGVDVPAEPTPSKEQGWGFPVLDDALHFAGETRTLQVLDVPLVEGLRAGESRTLLIRAKPGTPLKAVLVWTDPAGTPRGFSDTTPQLVNDLDLRVTGPDARLRFGNGDVPDRLNNVEVVMLEAPAAGTYAITVTAHQLRQGPRQSFAVVVTGDVSVEPVTRRRSVRR
ncbi:MAG: S8 family serine peptidase [Thermoanaerobaculia bacterium]